MSEQFRGETGPNPERAEDQKHKALQAAMDEEDRIMKEIDNVFATTPDRAEAERMVMEKYVPLMEEARKKSDETLREWLEEMREAHEEEQEDDQ